MHACEPGSIDTVPLPDESERTLIDKSLFTLPGAGRTLGVLLVFALLQAACVVGQAFGLAAALTNLWNGQALDAQATLLAQFALCFVGRQAIVHVQSALLDGYAHERTAELRTKLLKRVFDSQSHMVREHGTAKVTSSVLEGIDQVESYLAAILPKLIGVAAIPPIVLVAVFASDWVSGVILLVLFPTIIFYMVLLGRQAQEKAADQYETYNVMSNHFVDTLRGIEVLKVFGASKGYGARIYEVSERFREATIDTIKIATLSGMVLDLIATAGLAGVSIMLAFRLMDGSIGLYAGLVALILSPEYFKPIREFASDFHASLDGKNALVAITAMIADEAQPHVECDVPHWTEHSTLAFDQVGFAYPDVLDDGSGADNAGQAAGTQVLHALQGASFAVEGFAKVGIVGASGSGKSTLANLLGGFISPTEGAIRIDGAEVADLRQTGWQSQLLYIPQDPYVFHATLRDNIAFYTPEASEQDVLDAVAIVGLDGLVDELEDGLDTVIGEGARGLSGGQAQRIALARALLDERRKVLLFDEPTAHLDIETELEMKMRMLPIMQDRLVFFATHRLHWLDTFDWVIVLEDGCIAEQGTPRQLLDGDGALSRLCMHAKRGEAS